MCLFVATFGTRKLIRDKTGKIFSLKYAGGILRGYNETTAFLTRTLWLQLYIVTQNKVVVSYRLLTGSSCKRSCTNIKSMILWYGFVKVFY
jgi:hypothetical protein